MFHGLCVLCSSSTLLLFVTNPSRTTIVHWKNDNWLPMYVARWKASSANVQSIEDRRGLNSSNRPSAEHCTCPQINTEHFSTLSGQCSLLVRAGLYILILDTAAKSMCQRRCHDCFISFHDVDLIDYSNMSVFFFLFHDQHFLHWVVGLVTLWTCNRGLQIVVLLLLSVVVSATPVLSFPH